MGAGGAAPEPFGALLRRRRRAAGLTQEGLAERAGLSVRGVSDLERGARGAPQRETVRRLARGLGLRPAGAVALEAGAAAARWRPGPAAGRRPAPPPPSDPPAGGAPRNLPRQLTSFVGRERELAAVQAVLARQRLVTLTGAGGTGKTRLALRVAAGPLPAYPDGVWLVDLAPLAAPELVPVAVAVALGVRELPNRPLLATLAGAVGPRRVLLLLDNCEHLLDACATLADALLRACPRLTILATSREALGIAGETVWRVPSLPIPAAPGGDAPGDPTALARYAAVRLFCERAAAVQPGFALTAENAAAVGQVCIRLDGIPLALELAAARVGALSVAQLAARLDDRFRLLTAGARSALPRQQTLRATVDWSHDLLTGAERAVLRRLSVFRGGCTLVAAEVVCAGEPVVAADVLHLVARLVDKSLVLMEPAGPESRYRLLETVRLYAGERLQEAGEAAAAHGRLHGWLLALARAAAQEPRTGGPRRAGLLAEEDNLRAALEWSLGAAPAAGLELAACCADPWQWWGRHDEGARWLERLLRRVPATPPFAQEALRVRARALYWFGRLVREVGETERARAPLAESVSLFRQLGDEAGAARALNNLGMVARADGRDEDALRLFEAALATFARSGHTERAVGAQRNLGLLWLTRGDARRAREALEASVALARRTPGAGDGVALARLGVIARLEGDRPRARRLLDEALAPLRAGGFPWGIWVARAALGDLHAEEGDEAAAHACYDRIIAEAGGQGFGPGWELGLIGLGLLALRRGDHLRAARLLGALTPAQHTRTRMHAPYAVPPVEAALTVCRAVLGDDGFEDARRWGRVAPLRDLAAFAVQPTPASRPPRRRADAAAPDGDRAPAWASPAACHAGLTRREWEVLALLVAGASNRDIAERLVISPHTAVRHVHSVAAKLGARSRGSAVARATGLDGEPAGLADAAAGAPPGTG